MIEWLWSRKVLLAKNHFDAVAFIRTRAGEKLSDLQIALFAVALVEGSAEFIKQHAFQLRFATQRPLSRGLVRLRKAENSGQSSSTTCSPIQEMSKK